MAKQVAGAARLAKGEVAEGLARLEESVAVAEAMPPPRGAADPAKPAHELYGEALLAAARPADAAALFEAALLRMPRRPRSLLGLARARAELGERDAALVHYRELAAIWEGREVEELEEVRRQLAALAAR